MKQYEGKIVTLFCESGFKISGFVKKWRKTKLILQMDNGNEFVIFNPITQILMCEIQNHLNKSIAQPILSVDRLQQPTTSQFDHLVNEFKTGSNYATPTNIKVRSVENNTNKENVGNDSEGEGSLHKLLNSR